MDFEIKDDKLLEKYSGSEENVAVPNGVESIMSKAFNNQVNIKSVHLPDTVIKIGNEAFKWCIHLEEIPLNHVRMIGEKAFSFCRQLKSVELSDELTRIESNTFSECNRLSRIQLSKNLKYIGDSAFINCSDLVEIAIPGTVESIGEKAFKGCKNLEKVFLANGIIEIGANAFSGCKSLSEITIPDSVIRIGEGAFSECNGLSRIQLSKNLKYIGDSAFINCSDLVEIAIPGTVESIGEKAFIGCKNLEKVFLANGIIEIGANAFSGCKRLSEITIPDSVIRIGEGAFEGCSGVNDKDIPERFKEIYGEDYLIYMGGVTDETGCIVKNGELIDYPHGCEVVTIPDSVTVIRGIKFENVIKQIILPDSIRLIENTEFPYKVKVNLPKGYLQQQSKLPADMTLKLARGVWLPYVTDRDLASLFLFQSGKYLIDWCLESFKKNPDAIAQEMNTVLGSSSRGTLYTKAAEFIFENKGKIKQETIDEFYNLAISAKAKKAVDLIGTIATKTLDEIEISKDGSKEENDIEKYCREHFIEHYLDKSLKKVDSMLVNDKAFGKVLYKGSKEKVPPFIVKCVFTPYMELMKEKPKQIGGYKSDFLRVNFLKDIDRIAESFDKDSFTDALEELSDFNFYGWHPQKLIPLCRFGTGKQIKEVISKMKKWESWYDYGAKGRSGIIVLRGALMLSDTREAMLYMEKQKCLGHYAKMRGMDEDNLRDNILADFGFDKDGKKSFDIGGNIIDLTMGQDLTLTLYDHNADKIVKSVPKKGADPEKQVEAAAEVSDIKKNLKKVIKARNDILFEDFLSGSTRKADSWKASYLNNPVLHKVAELIVWNQKKATFILTKDSVIDCHGKEYIIDDKTPVGVAHPIEMDKAEIKAWQDYFLNNGLKQPFEQIWEPVINLATVKEDRYEGCMIPYYRFYGQVKHGIEVIDSNFHNEIDIYLKDCDADVVRIDWDRHDISMDHRFEIKSIKIKKASRVANHLIAYFDKLTVYERVLKDDAENIAERLPSFTLAQISDFIKAANENNANNVLALLMDYKKANFADFDPMDEFVLD